MYFKSAKLCHLIFTGACSLHFFDNEKADHLATLGTLIKAMHSFNIPSFDFVKMLRKPIYDMWDTYYLSAPAKYAVFYRKIVSLSSRCIWFQNVHLSGAAPISNLLDYVLAITACLHTRIS